MTLQRLKWHIDLAKREGWWWELQTIWLLALLCIIADIILWTTL